ncbi:MAG: 2-C-methyl-D-erythritol 4-phosphate cytidylyltransferase [Desulfatitalea sp.]|nr:2-C-methyl-D-erythritol 4-phosphate cytidylyltransferase [Desulfatitalea sp.]
MNHALIVAAGQGVRMGGKTPKQFLTMAGKPILAHTLAAFDAHEDVDRITLCVPAELIGFCRRQILNKIDLRADIRLASGGPRRQDSVHNGLQTMPEDGIVLIHDGVRPLVTHKLIDACLKGAQTWDACIPVMPVTDTLKRIDDQARIVETVSRQGMVAAQTPQAFTLSLIKNAYKTAQEKGWQATDDASIVERLGRPVHTIAGLPDNIKITTPADLARAEVLLVLKNRDKGFAVV